VLSIDITITTGETLDVITLTEQHNIYKLIPDKLYLDDKFTSMHMIYVSC